MTTCINHVYIYAIRDVVYNYTEYLSDLASACIRIETHSMHENAFASTMNAFAPDFEDKLLSPNTNGTFHLWRASIADCSLSSRLFT